MSPKTYNRFKTMGYNLYCKYCEKEIKPFDEVESKASGKKGPKLYHAECYDGTHLDFYDGKIFDGHGNEILKYDEDTVDEDHEESKTREVS